jgi:hypothetical protein
VVAYWEVHICKPSAHLADKKGTSFSYSEYPQVLLTTDIVQSISKAFFSTLSLKPLFLFFLIDIVVIYIKVACTEI